MDRINHQFRLAARPTGLPQNTDWSRTQEAAGEAGDGQLLVKVLYVSLDPAMRGWMSDKKSYVSPVGLNEVMRAVAVGQVLASKHGAYRAGDYVSGFFGVQEYALSDGKGVLRIDPTMASLPSYLNAVGMPGMTAYFGLLDIAQLKATDTVVVSSAAGAVGALVGQIAKLKGCRVIGIAGGPAKCQYLRDVGFDGAIDYKHDVIKDALTTLCPQGVDVYFDNVGGDMLDVVMTRLARGARIALCGAMSQYNNTTASAGLKNYMALLVNRASIKGFVVFDFAERFAEATREIAGWVRTGKLQAREDIVSGLDNFPDALLKLFKGENQGKLLLKVAEPD